MIKRSSRFAILLFAILFLTPQTRAEERFMFEVGPIGGASYYLDELNGSFLEHIRPTYGGIFRYKFNPRWVIAARVQASSVEFYNNIVLNNEVIGGRNRLIEGDVTAEFNFFHLERNTYHRDAKIYSPYVFLGVGVGTFPDEMSMNASDINKAEAYIPFGFGFKWNFTPRMNLNIEWQHQLYFSDALEGIPAMDNSYELNGSNFMNNDIFSALTIGLTVNFGRERAVCRQCR